MTSQTRLYFADFMIAKKLARPTWKIADYMSTKGSSNLDRTKLQKIITLSGVTADPEEIASDLGHQLQFLEVLLTVDTKSHKPLPRLVAPVTCPSPEAMAALEAEAQDPPAWTPTSLAAKAKNGYYVVRKRLGPQA